MGDKSRGIYHKFVISRTDGTSAPGGKHDGCFYFVLDLDHDPHARAALKAYADSCRAQYPRLAADLDVNVAQCSFGCDCEGPKKVGPGWHAPYCSTEIAKATQSEPGSLP